MMSTTDRFVCQFNSYRDEQALRLLEGTAAAEEGHDEHERTDGQEDVEADVVIVLVLRHRDEERRIGQHPYCQHDCRQADELEGRGREEGKKCRCINIIITRYEFELVFLQLIFF